MAPDVAIKVSDTYYEGRLSDELFQSVVGGGQIVLGLLVMLGLFRKVIYPLQAVILVGGALAINGIINTVDAHVTDATLTAAGDISVAAYDTSSIKSLTGGAAISIGGSGAGIGLSANFIANDVTATEPVTIVNSNSLLNSFSN